MTTLGTPQVAEELGFIAFRKIPRNHAGVTSLCWCHLPETQSFVLHHRILCPFLNSHSISGAFSILHRKEKKPLIFSFTGVGGTWGFWCEFCLGLVGFVGGGFSLYRMATHISAAKSCRGSRSSGCPFCCAKSTLLSRSSKHGFCILRTQPSLLRCYPPNATLPAFPGDYFCQFKEAANQFFHRLYKEGIILILIVLNKINSSLTRRHGSFAPP